MGADILFPVQTHSGVQCIQEIKDVSMKCYTYTAETNFINTLHTVGNLCFLVHLSKIHEIQIVNFIFMSKTCSSFNRWCNAWCIDPKIMTLIISR